VHQGPLLADESDAVKQAQVGLVHLLEARVTLQRDVPAEAAAAAAAEEEVTHTTSGALCVDS
jgi:hypothetical protein